MVDDARRLELLAAIGIDVYRLRGAEAAGFAPAHGAAAARVGRPALLVAAAGAVRATIDDKAPLARIVRALGLDAADVIWVDPDAMPAQALHEAAACLLVGAHAARSVSARMPIGQQRAATIVVIDEPAVALRDATARRALWQSLKPLARRLGGV